MTIDTFWSIIEAVHNQSPDDMDKKCDALRGRLSALSPDDMRGFRQHFDECDARAYDWGLWGAAYIIHGGCSDDSFSDFRSSLISRGRADFERALSDPDSLADLGLTEEDACYEGYAYAVADAEQTLLGEVGLRATPFPADPSGEQWDEDDDAALAARFPRLHAAYSACAATNHTKALTVMDPTKKRFKIPGDQIRQLIPNMGGCLASDRIMVDGLPVGYMYREEPDRDVDSGWRFLSGDESQVYVDDPDHLGIYAVNTVCNYDPSIIPYLDSPVGSAFGRVAGTDTFQAELRPS